MRVEYRNYSLLLLLLLLVPVYLMPSAGLSCFAETPSRENRNAPSSLEKNNTDLKKTKIWFAEMLMQVGDSKKKIFPHLKNLYHVEKSGKDWVVKSRETGNVFGYVRFINGRLASAARVWASLSDPEAVNMGNSLYNVLSGLTANEIKNISITTRSIQKKNYEQKLVVFKTLHKNIRLSIYSGRRINKVEVQEILF